MKIKNVICELKSGASAYSSAYKLIRSLYPAFTFSFIGVSILFILASVLGALLPYLLKKTAEAYTFSEGILSAFFLITMTYAVSWTVTEVLKNIRGIFSAGILAQADAALTSNTMEILLSISFRKQKEFEPAVLAANIDRGAQSFSALTLSVFWTLLPITVEISMAVYFLYQSLGFTYSLIFSISVIGMIFLAFSIAIFSRHIHTDIMNTQNGVYSYTIERLAMPLDIRINSAHAKERVLRQEILNQYVNTIKLTNKKMGFLLSLQAVAVGVLLAISVLVLVFFKKASHIGTGDFIMIVGYISMLTFQLRTIAGASIDIQRQIVYLKILLEHLELRVFLFKRFPVLIHVIQHIFIDHALCQQTIKVAVIDPRVNRYKHVGNNTTPTVNQTMILLRVIFRGIRQLDTIGTKHLSIVISFEHFGLIILPLVRFLDAPPRRREVMRHRQTNH